MQLHRFLTIVKDVPGHYELETSRIENIDMPRPTTPYATLRMAKAVRIDHEKEGIVLVCDTRNYEEIDENTSSSMSWLNDPANEGKYYLQGDVIRSNTAA